MVIMIFQDILKQQILTNATELLGCANYLEDIGIVRLRSLEMPPRDSFRQLAKVVLDDVPFANNVGLHNVNYKLNYGSRLCQLNDMNGRFDSNGLKFVLYTTYSTDYGEVCLIIAKKGEVWKIMRALKKFRESSLEKVDAPILDHDLIHKVEKNTINFILKARKRKLNLNRGVLLYGEPGNGKSLLCNYIRKLGEQNQLQSMNIKGKDAASKNIDGAFKDINFFDDIEINLLNRKAGGISASDLLGAIDGVFKDGDPKTFLFTTNEKITDIEDAFIRPGRIDLVIEMKKPTPELRKRVILEKFYDTMKQRIVTEGKVDWLVEATEDFSFAELVGVQNTMLIADMDDAYMSTEQAYYEFCDNMKLKKGLQEGSRKLKGFGG